ncbi:uncharacterized protein LOC110105860 [Dendrobium catenatum]|uniref:uncharacterized protein LOC110105860 n=1 Tax=Dendrobium catenatum TaxID=906689 RepID=UPI0009F3D2AB|nr:uncharacterized protein LOC110105860 [Dendrobium catenatum]
MTGILGIASYIGIPLSVDSLTTKRTRLTFARDQPWVILGDFNCCRFETEKATGSLLTDSRLGELNNMVFYYGVQDLSLVGLFYTWFIQRVDNPIHIKLDRIIVNSILLDCWPSTYYKIDTPLGSDHSPLIFKPSHDKPISARFMFKNYWINMEGFWDDVFSAFSIRTPRFPFASFYHSLNCLKRILKNKNWASSYFLSSSILELKNKQHNFLLEIEAHPLCGELNHDLKCINENLASLRSSWSSWIFQRAKALWFTHGEDDIGFLYAKLRKLYNAPRATLELPLQIPSGKMVHPHLHNMKTWHIIGTQVFNDAKNYFSSGSLPKEVKATAITLIPKCSHASNINDFRPISLCNVFYKTMAKMSANRLKIVLPLIIHESQSGFISNRCSTDNIILASEILREFKGSHKSFCAKLDINKAFDSVSREFLIVRLLQKGFPEVFVSWIKGCISDMHFSICLNGSLEGFFNSSSGLQQGCPLSPLLFCIIVDVLSNILHSTSNAIYFKGITCKENYINHLIYADDLLVFGVVS